MYFRVNKFFFFSKVTFFFFSFTSRCRLDFSTVSFLLGSFSLFLHGFYVLLSPYKRLVLRLLTLKSSPSFTDFQPIVVSLQSLLLPSSHWCRK